MDSGLLFESSIVFEDASTEDCIRQSLIDVNDEGLPASEAIPVFRAALRFTGSQLTGSGQISLRELIIRLHKKYTETHAILNEFLASIEKESDMSIMILRIAISVCEEAPGNEPRTLFEMASRLLVQLLCAGGNIIEFGSGEIDRVTACKVFAIILKWVTPEDDDLRKVLTVLARELDDSDACVCGCHMTKEMVRLDMFDVLRESHKWADYRELWKDEELSARFFEYMCTERELFTSMTTVLGYGSLSRQSRDLCMLFLRKCMEFEIPNTGEVNVIVPKMFVYLNPEDISAEMWEFLRSYDIGNLPRPFVEKIQDWRVPDYLLLMLDDPTGVIPDEELERLYCEVPKRLADFRVVFGHRNQSMQQVFGSPAFWINYFTVVSQCQQMVEAMADVHMYFSTLWSGEHNGIADIVIGMKGAEFVCSFICLTGITYGDDEMGMRAYDLVASCEKPSCAFWMLFSANCAVLLPLLSDERLAHKKYEIMLGLSFLWFNRRGRRGCSTSELQASILPHLSVLEQTPESIQEIRGLIKRVPARLDEVFSTIEMSPEARSVVAIAGLCSAIFPVATEAMFEIGNLRSHKVMLYAVMLRVGNQSHRRRMRGVEMLQDMSSLLRLSSSVWTQKCILTTCEDEFMSFLAEEYLTIVGEWSKITNDPLPSSLSNLMCFIRVGADLRDYPRKPYTVTLMNVVASLVKNASSREAPTQNMVLDILRFYRANADCTIAAGVRTRLDLSLLPATVVTQFITESMSELSLSFVIMVVQLCQGVPRIKVDDIPWLEAILESVVCDETCLENIRIMVKFVYMVRQQEVLQSFVDRDLSDPVKKILVAGPSACMKTVDPDIANIIMKDIMECTNGQKLKNIIVRYITSDNAMAINYSRLTIESLHSRFAMKVDTMFEKLKEGLGVSPRRASLIARAVMEMYSIPDSVDFMLIQRAEPYPLQRPSEQSLSVLEQLLLEMKNEARMNALHAIRILANAIPIIFQQFDKEEFSLADILDILLTHAERVGECMNQTEEMSEKVKAVGAIVGESMMTLEHLMRIPAMIDTFMSMFTAADLLTMSSGRLLCCAILIQELLLAPTVSHVVVAYMLKSKWMERVEVILSKTGQQDKPDRIEEAAIVELLDVTKIYLSCLNGMSAEAAVVIDELMHRDNPCSLCFTGESLALKYHHRFGAPSFLSIITKWVGESYRQVMNNIDVSSFNLHGSGTANQNQFKTNLHVAARRLPVRKVLYEIPDMPLEALEHLPQEIRSNVLYHRMPIFGVRPDNILQVERYMVDKPVWVSHYIHRTQALMLLPEHYYTLWPILSVLASLEVKADIEPGELRLEEFCQPKLIHVLFDILIQHRPVISIGLAHGILEQLGKNMAALDEILYTLSRMLQKGDPRDSGMIVNIIELMKGCAGFMPVFEHECGHLLLQSIPFCASNTDILLRVVVLYTAVETDIPNDVVQAVSFILVTEEFVDPRVIQLCAKLRPDTREKISPGLQIAFTNVVKALATHPVSVGRQFSLFLREFRWLIAGKQTELIGVLDSLLKNMHPATHGSVSELLQCLCPQREDSSSQVIGSTPDVSLSDSTGGLTIPERVRERAPEFWQVVSDNREKIGELVKHSGHGGSDDFFKFVNMYPEILMLEPRIVLFRKRMAKRSTGGSDIRVKVRRDTILHDSFRSISAAGFKNINRNIHVTFQNEPGIDAGGVRRDWFTCLIKELFNENYGLFAAYADGRCYQPSPHSYRNKESIEYLKFAGAIIARAIVDGMCVDAHLTRALLKHLLGYPRTLHDLEDIDPAVHRSLIWMLENDITGLDSYFTVDFDDMGRHTTVPLKQNGADIEVTNENKAEYVKLVVDHKLTVQIDTQIKAFLEGFYGIIPRENLRIFRADELDLLICGVPDIDIDDLQSNIRFGRPLTVESPVVVYFFNVLRIFTPEERAKLLLFVTGSSKVPVGGFQALANSGSPMCICPGGDPTRLPAAHTCSNQLDLPNYASQDELRTKLLFAIQECNSFGFA